MKHNPVVGEPLYVTSYGCGTRHPYSVESVSGNTCVIREADMYFPQPCYYDTRPTLIFASDPKDTTKRRMKLRYSAKKDRWQETPACSYPYVAVFGRFDYEPYLD